MTSIFANKQLLDQEYKQLFLKRISDCSLLGDCISGRYNKNTVSEEELNILFSNNHKKIYDFIGKSNENRIRYFFGTAKKMDVRDDQIRLVDRFILDSVHFDVINTLLMQFINEYHDNQASIDEEWEAEIKNHEGLGIIPTDCIIQNAIKNYKSELFDSLVFPSKKPVALFKLSGKKIIPDEQIFKKWLPESSNKSSNSGTGYLLIAGITVTIIVFIPLIYLGITASAAGFGATAAATTITTIEVLVGIGISFLAGCLLIDYFNPVKKHESVNALNSQLHSPATSTEMMMTQFPRNSDTQSNTPASSTDTQSVPLFSPKNEHHRATPPGHTQTRATP